MFFSHFRVAWPTMVRTEPFKLFKYFSFKTKQL